VSGEAFTAEVGKYCWHYTRHWRDLAWNSEYKPGHPCSKNLIENGTDRKKGLLGRLENQGDGECVV